MYDVAEIIKKIIGHHQRRCSWVEFVSEGPQAPRAIFSHSWIGRFRDFMSVVDRFAHDHSLSASVPIWVCAFANNQFGEDFGSGLRESPFYMAVQASTETVLVVDRDASSLTRIWCGFEVHVTSTMQKPLSVYTSTGKVGKDVTSGRLVDAVEEFDVMQMEATEDADRRQILNYLGGGEAHERDGLKVDASGQLSLVNGYRKSLSDDALVVDDTLRSNSRDPSGKREYQHEAKLFKLHEEKFKEFNANIQQTIRNAANVPEQLSEGCSRIPNLAHRGITLGELRALAKWIKTDIRRWASSRGDGEWETMTLKMVADKFMQNDSVTPSKRSYVEEIGAGARSPQYIIDDAWAGSCKRQFDAIDWFAEALCLSDNAVFYFSAACINQHDAMTEFNEWNNHVETLIRNCVGFLALVPSADREQIIRSNRMKQLQLCFTHARPIYFGCSTGILACSQSFSNSAWEFGSFDPEVARVFINANWQEAKCAFPDVDLRIKEEIRQARGGFEGFTDRIARVATGPFIRQAAFIGDFASIAEVRSLCRRPGFLINSSVLKGGLGETAVHIAAAAGNVKMLEMLLTHKADPNAEDHVRETPLHYAAMSGTSESIKPLLTRGAEPQVESAFCETPLCIAEQNPAGFLLAQRKTEKAATLLKIAKRQSFSVMEAMWEARADRTENRSVCYLPPPEATWEARADRTANLSVCSLTPFSIPPLIEPAHDHDDSTEYQHLMVGSHAEFSVC